jgi:Zn-dependent M28 family amino/carboxypeptidase
MMRRSLVLLATAGVLATGCSFDNGNGPATPPESVAPTTPERLQQAVSVERLRSHLEALQRIAAENGGSRESGSAGYDASVEYVTDQLRAAGYRPRLQRFRLAYSREVAPAKVARVSPEPAAYRTDADFVAFTYSGSGEVAAPLEPIDVASGSSGCESSDFEPSARGSIVLIRRGGCLFVVKVRNAAAAGAAGVLVFNDGAPGHEHPLAATLLRPAALPALSLSHDAGEELARLAAAGPVRMRVRARFETVERQTANVLADLPGSQEGAPILLGAHLDSIANGPGINDNGSGVATLLEIAKQARRLGYRPPRSLRFAFWAAEELGLVGSAKYVERLGDEPRAQIAAVLNFDMLGSPNAQIFVYDGDPTIERWLEDAVRREGFEPIPIALEGRSDHAPFEDIGIPVGGIFTGADEVGPGGKPHDACYHRPCDTLANVDLATLEGVADAVIFAVFGRLTSEEW